MSGPLEQRVDSIESNLHAVGVVLIELGKAGLRQADLNAQFEVRMHLLEDAQRRTDEKVSALAGVMYSLAGTMDSLAIRMDALTARMDSLAVRMDELAGKVDALVVIVDGIIKRSS